jgi:hypothetical protein
MTAAATTRSAYPAPVDDLLPKAIALAEQVGDVPSLRRLIAELRVGAPKARALAERVAQIRREQGTTQPLGDAEVAAAAIVHELQTRRPEPDRVRSVDTSTTVDVPERSHTDPPAPVDEASPVDVASAVDAVFAAPAVTQPAVLVDTPAPVVAPAVRPVRWWPVLLLAVPAFVAIWSGWVGLGGLTGFGMVHPLPGIADDFTINSAITLPVGMEAYAAYALRAWFAPGASVRARRFAKVSAIGSLCLGALGQVTYHLMTAAGWTAAPWPVTTLVACLPVAVLGMGAALAHLLRNPDA